jgi:bifunctional ADP-heptose synthase (sugar kinase/adenylyltransferase)
VRLFHPQNDRNLKPRKPSIPAALAAGATLPESLALANAAASIVIHQLGTTGSATVPQIRELLAAGQ